MTESSGSNEHGNSEPTDPTNSRYDGSGLEIAVIGMSGRFPGADGIDAFWENLKNGIESISYLTPKELEHIAITPDLIDHPGFVKAYGASVHGKEYFDAYFFDYLPHEADVMDPQIRLFHEVAWEALEYAGYAPGCYAGPIGVYGGASINTAWQIITRLAGKVAPLGEFAANNLIGSEYICSRISYRLDLKGPSFSIQTACSTSLTAIHLACQGLLSGECDIALAGGASAFIEPGFGYLYQDGMIYSKDGHCRAFDANSSGTVNGEAAGVVVLKPLEDALTDHDHILAIIKGSAINNDGAAKMGYSAPSVKGQVEVIREALAAADVPPESIGFVETHGTGTNLGDPVEVEALNQAYQMKGKNRCAIGSLKSNIGHTGIAAGISSFIKTVLALNHKRIPPSLHFQSPNPRIDFENSPFYVNHTLSEWVNKHPPLRAAVSSFGVGGTNAHIILEEAPAPQPLPNGRPWTLILLSAKTPTALETSAQNLARFLQDHPAASLADTAYTLQLGRKTMPFRKMLVARSTDGVSEALASPGSPEIKTLHAGEHNRPVVFMFSGQGFQYLNMGLQLYRSEPSFRRTIDRCAQILEPILAIDIRDVVFPGKETPDARERLEQVDILQPLTFSFQYALSALLIEWGVIPDAVIGHSFGEYAAACTAGIFSLEDALILAARRGASMQTVAPGLMLALSMPEEQVEPFLNEDITLAAVNSPEHCILSGPPAAIQNLADTLSQKGHQCRILHVSVAGHSPAMDPILDQMTHSAQNITLNPPDIPFVSVLTGRQLSDAEALEPSYWARQLRHTVRFNDAISLLLEDPAKIFVEIGPGSALCTFLKQNNRFNDQHAVLNVSRHPLEDFPDDYFFIHQLGLIWLNGGTCDWHAFYKHESRGRIPLPTYPFERQRYWPDGEDYRRYKILERSLSGSAINDPSSDTLIPFFKPREPAGQDNGRDEKSQQAAAARASQHPGRRPRPDLGTVYQEPVTPTQQKLADMWQVFFGIEKIGIYDSFFELGGDSLKMITIAARIHKELNVKIPAVEFFKQPTIHLLTRYIDQSTARSLAPIQALPPQDHCHYSLSPGQQRLWRMCQSPQANRSYNMISATALKGTFHIAAIEDAFSILIARHESLRTQFVIADSETKQLISGTVPFSINLEVLTPESPIIPSLCHEFASYQFDLSQAPLFRVKIVQLRKDLHILLLNIHHIIGDGWSVDLFARELAILYNAFTTHSGLEPCGARDLLPPLHIQYKDYSFWYKQVLSSEKAAQSRQYWLDKLSPEIPVIDLPADFQRPAVKTYRGKLSHVVLDEELTGRLVHLGDAAEATLFMTLLATVKILIWLQCGEPDITVGTQTAGRIHPDLENQFGYYVNLLPLRDILEENLSFTDFLQKVKQTTSEAYDHHIYPFESLLRDLEIKPPRNRHPLFDITVDLQNHAHQSPLFHGLDTSPLEMEYLDQLYTTSKFDLTFTFARRDRELALMLEYDSDLFKEERIHNLLTQFIQLLQNLSRSPDQPLRSIKANIQKE